MHIPSWQIYLLNKNEKLDENTKKAVKDISMFILEVARVRVAVFLFYLKVVENVFLA
jgi:hypothetical protein